jgi:hypothetical protein
MNTLHMLHSLDTPVREYGVTVRLGDKWAKIASEDQDIELCVCDPPDTHTIQGQGTIVEVWHGSFADVPARLIEQEHEIRSRQFSGLYDSMKKAYGDKIDLDSEVTVLKYLRQK